MAAHDYVASPRGNGLDCHRFWESLYLGAIPIVEHSFLDPLYSQAGNVLFVQNFTDVNEELLVRNLPRFRDMMTGRGTRPSRVLTRSHWQGIVEGVRTEALKSLGLNDVQPRKRCWGLKYENG